MAKAGSGTKKRFRAEDYSVHVRAEPMPLRPVDPDEFVVKHRAQLLPRGAAERADVRFPDDDRAVAAIEWERVNLGAAVAYGEASVMEVFDAHSQELYEAGASIFDEHGEARDELDLVMDGEDVLYIWSLRATPGLELFDVGRELLEHVLRYHGRGCLAAVYHLDEVQRLDTARLLIERGFKLLKGERLYLADLGLRRAGLPDEPEGDDIED